jgi:hypothetical protein
MDCCLVKDKIKDIAQLLTDILNFVEEEEYKTCKHEELNDCCQHYHQTRMVVIPSPKKFHFNKKGPTKLLISIFNLYGDKMFSGDSYELARSVDMNTDAFLTNIRRLHESGLVNIKEEKGLGKFKRSRITGQMTIAGEAYLNDNVISHD